jgi:hypothetical protein
VSANTRFGISARRLLNLDSKGTSQSAQWGTIMQIFVFAFSLLLVTTGIAHAQLPQIERIEFAEYGIYTVDRDIQGRDALGINKAAASNVRHAATLRTIPAQIGATFGFRYKLIGKPHDAPVDLRKIVIFPPPGIVPSRSSRPIAQDEFTLQTRIGLMSYASYTLEDSFELVPGAWTIEIWYGNQKLGTQSFKVINLNSECEQECGGF